MKKSIQRSILVSYLIGLPIGLLFVASIIVLPPFLSGEGLLSFIMMNLYGKAIVGLVISFIISLWFGGLLAYRSIKKGNSLLLTSFKYSTLINLLVWIVFSIVASFSKDNEFGFFFIPVIAFTAFIIGTLFTTITIGLLIAYRTRIVIRQSSNNELTNANKT